mgnify:CR=1 FL=1
MKIVYMKDTIVLFLNKTYIQRIDFTNKEATEKYIKGLLFKLKDSYGLTFKGYYDINLHVDICYGVIIEIIKEELEYFDYFNNQVEINTKIINDSFLYEVTDIDQFENAKFKIYFYNNNFYLQVLDKQIDMGEVLEFTNRIIYGKEVCDVLKKALVVR